MAAVLAVEVVEALVELQEGFSSHINCIKYHRSSKLLLRFDLEGHRLKNDFLDALSLLPPTAQHHGLESVLDGLALRRVDVL